MEVNTNFLRYYRNGALLGRNSWESFINYKLLNAEKLKFDCDRSAETKAALKEVFDEAQYTDTLISPQSYVTLYMRYYHADLLEYSERHRSLIVPDISELRKQMIHEGLAVGTVNNSSVWAYFAKKNEIKVHDSMLTFLHTVYTLPNFSSVCHGFNKGRAAKTKDNFIIALYHIYYYFQKRESGTPNANPRNSLGKFLSSIEYKKAVYLTQAEVVNEVQNWLDNYSGFADFIEYYYLQDFLEDPDHSYSKPKEVWAGMFNGKLQPSKKEFFPSIDFLTKAIRSRGNRMKGAN
ncbi:hypothetical protein J14TS2_46810 [Bacillus sp. J14TS2]|uniref:hypothetical protein n=1 Tax=Bacillus sp. J14TS2 TaxID=2807188 RepID=UPI001B0B280E|nr:hypothetical protein [Bacillus sp. J14TS2]GIN74206.1 hypothetical protein J14TS2_46810 [Bacillus sp. J14TS2]